MEQGGLNRREIFPSIVLFHAKNTTSPAKILGGNKEMGLGDKRVGLLNTGIIANEKRRQYKLKAKRAEEAAMAKRSKPFIIDNQDYLIQYIAFLNDAKEGENYWHNWHEKCVELYGYREEQKGDEVIIHNEENKGATLTLASVKARFTRLRKKVKSAAAKTTTKGGADQVESFVLKSLTSKPKPPPEPKAPPIDFELIVNLAKASGGGTVETEEV